MEVLIQMAELDREWVKKQIDKAIGAQSSMVKAERDHRDKLTKHPDVAETYDRIIRDDEKNLNKFKEVGKRYGIDKPSSEGAGGIMGALKGMAESATAADAF